MIDLALEHKEYEDQLVPKINDTIKNASFINGEEVKHFSESLKNYLNVQYCIPCGNGTDALQIALMSLDLNKGDEILIPSFNYVSAAEATVLLGLTPVFVDADLNTFNIDISSLESKITHKSKVIIATHLFGLATDMDTIMTIAKKYNLKVIEDNAQSLGCKVGDKLAGTIGDIGTTSFFPTKNLGGLGDGGAIFTNDNSLAASIKSIASHGQTQKYSFERIGINSRLDTIQASALAVKLNFLNNRLEKRSLIGKRYIDKINANSLKKPSLIKGFNHTFNQFSIQSENRDELKNALAEKGIPTMIYYHLPLHQQSAYKAFEKGSLPNAEKLAKTVLSLPIHPMLTVQEQDYIIETLNNHA